MNGDENRKYIKSAQYINGDEWSIDYAETAESKMVVPPVWKSPRT